MLKAGELKRLIFNMGISYSNSLLGFIIFLLLARLLGAVDYSMVAIGIAVGGFIIPLLDLGSAKTFVRDAVLLKDKVDVEDLAQVSFNIRLTVALIVSLFLLLFGSFYMDSIEEMVTVFFFSIWVGLIGLYPTSWFDYFSKTSSQNICVMFERVLVVFLIGTLILFKVEAQLMISLMLVMSRVFSIIYQVELWRKKFANIIFTFKLSLPKLNFPGTNVQITIALLANALMIYGNQLILAGAGNPVDLSAYSFAFQLISLISLFQGQAIRVFNRDISEICHSRSSGQLIRHFLYTASFMVIVSVVMALVVLVIANYIPDILDDVRFGRMVEFMPILCVWVIIAGAGQVVSHYLLELKQEFFHLMISIVSGIFALFLGVMFIPEYGAISIATILVSVHSAAISVRVMRLLYIIRLRFDSKM